MLGVTCRLRVPALAVLIAAASLAGLVQSGTAQAATCAGADTPFEKPLRRAGESPGQYAVRFFQATSQNQAAIVCLTNEKRAGHDTNPTTPGVQGLPALVVNSQLAATARDYSQDMVTRGYFDPVNHSTPEGHDLRRRLTDHGYCPACRAFAENILCKVGKPTPRQVVDAWMASGTNTTLHRGNILSPRFREIGVGSAFGTPKGSTGCKGQPGGTFTQDFGSR